MKQAPYTLDKPRRSVAIESIRKLCQKRNWTLHAIHVRNNHVHAVVTADRKPERVMHDFKSIASRGLNKAGFENNERIRWTRGGSTNRGLNKAGFENNERIRWTRGGSTKWINDDAYFNNAVNYVLNKQGVPMARWPDGG